MPHLTFFDAKGEQLFQLIGRWGDLPEAVYVASTIQISQVDLPPNGLPYKVDIAIKYARERDAYAWNNESDLNSEAKGRRDPRYKLGTGTYTVRVHLRGLNTYATHWLTLKNPGQNGALDLTPRRRTWTL